MFSFIQDEELRELLNKINNNDESINDIKSSLDFARCLNNVNKDEHDRLASEFIKNKNIISYICKWIKSINLSVLNLNRNFYRFIKLLMLKVDDENVKLDLFEICFKLRCEITINIAIDENKDELKELLFERLFNIIKRDDSKEYLNIFISVLLTKSDDIKDVIIFDFIELLYNITLDAKEYKQIDDLIEIIGIKNNDIKNELRKLQLNKFRNSNEYEIVNKIISDNNPIIKDLDIDILVISINSKNIQEIIKVLKYIKNNEIFELVINTILFSKNIDIDRDKLISIIAVEQIYTHNEQTYFVKNHIKKNNISLEKFVRENCPQNYINTINSKISKYIENNDINEIMSLLKQEQDNDIIKEISQYIVDSLLELNNLDTILKLWENIKLSVSLRLEYGNKIKDLIIRQGEISRESIQFLLDLDLDDMSFYKSIKNKKCKNRVLSIWSKNNKTGKIVDALKYMIDKEAQCIEDLVEVKSLIEIYNITDERLLTYIKLKVYSNIELSLLEIDYMNSEDSVKLDEIIDLVVEYNLENRLLNDRYILDMLDKQVKDYLSKKIITKSQSIEVLDAFWSIIDECVRSGAKRELKGNLEIIIPYITDNNDKIDWFLELLEQKKYNHDVIEYIIETCLETMARNKSIINQLNKEIEEKEPKVISEIAKKIVNPLVKLEKNIINISDEKQRNILINNIKALRYALDDISIKSVEEIQNYNKKVKLDDNIHALIGDHKSDLYTVETLGIKVNGEIIAKSMLCDKVGEEEVIG